VRLFWNVKVTTNTFSLTVVQQEAVGQDNQILARGLRRLQLYQTFRGLCPWTANHTKWRIPSMTHSKSYLLTAFPSLTPRVPALCLDNPSAVIITINPDSYEGNWKGVAAKGHLPLPTIFTHVRLSTLLDLTFLPPLGYLRMRPRLFSERHKIYPWNFLPVILMFRRITHR
jgi:hypothetical protein